MIKGKTPLQVASLCFNLKFLLVSDSGAGKTHLTGTYTQGPIHYYMGDPGGEKTLYKLLDGRPDSSPVTIDRFSLSSDGFEEFWLMLQKDAKNGLFDYLAENNGLLVPDSLTAVNDMCLAYIAKKNRRDLKAQKKGMQIQDWGQLVAHLKEFIAIMNNMPCAVAIPAHLHIDTDEQGAIRSRYPLISGQFRSSLGRFFDEVYLLETIGKKRRINFKEKGRFTAKTRVFTPEYMDDITMDDIATAYMTNDYDMKEVMKRKK